MTGLARYTIRSLFRTAPLQTLENSWLVFSWEKGLDRAVTPSLPEIQLAPCLPYWMIRTVSKPHLIVLPLIWVTCNILMFNVAPWYRQTDSFSEVWSGTTALKVDSKRGGTSKQKAVLLNRNLNQSSGWSNKSSTYEETTLRLFYVLP